MESCGWDCSAHYVDNCVQASRFFEQELIFLRPEAVPFRHHQVRAHVCAFVPPIPITQMTSSQQHWRVGKTLNKIWVACSGRQAVTPRRNTNTNACIDKRACKATTPIPLPRDIGAHWQWRTRAGIGMHAGIEHAHWHCHAHGTRTAQPPSPLLVSFGQRGLVPVVGPQVR